MSWKWYLLMTHTDVAPYVYINQMENWVTLEILHGENEVWSGGTGTYSPNSMTNQKHSLDETEIKRSRKFAGYTHLCACMPLKKKKKGNTAKQRKTIMCKSENKLFFPNKVVTLEKREDSIKKYLKPDCLYKCNFRLIYHTKATVIL